MPDETRGRLTLRTLAMPADTNPSGDIFGGWVMSQMDIAAGICAGQRADSRVVTVAVDSISFLSPIRVGDVLGVYADITRIGRTSIDIHIEAWARRNRIGAREKVTQANFKFVALDNCGKPTLIPEVAVDRNDGAHF